VIQGLYKTRPASIAPELGTADCGCYTAEPPVSNSDHTVCHRCTAAQGSAQRLKRFEAAKCSLALYPSCNCFGFGLLFLRVRGLSSHQDIYCRSAQDLRSASAGSEAAGGCKRERSMPSGGHHAWSRSGNSNARPPTAELPHAYVAWALTTLFFRSSGHFNTDPACRTGVLVRRLP
jgi:hypothetical protein